MPALLLKTSPDLLVRLSAEFGVATGRWINRITEMLETSTAEWNWYRSAIAGGDLFAQGE
jgi:hypothetical protein